MTIIQSFVGAKTEFNANVALIGVSATGAIGNPIAGSNVVVTLGSVTATALLASPSIMASASTVLNGVGATANTASANVALGESVDLTGVVATASVGDTFVGVGDSVFVGSVSAIASTADVDFKLSASVSVESVGASAFVEQVQGNPDPNAWDFSKFIFSAGTQAFDVTSMRIGTLAATTGALNANVAFDISGFDTDPQAVAFSPDGKYLYMLGRTGDDINWWELTAPWVAQDNFDTFKGVFSIAAQEINPTDLYFRSDGFRFYIIGTSGDDVNEYHLTTAWDITTASYVQNFSISAQETNPTCLTFSADGTKMYVGGSSSDAINEYDLGTAWDVSTASYSQNFSVATQDASGPDGIVFDNSGTIMIVSGASNKTFMRYDLSTPWDVSTASYLNSSTAMDVTVGGSTSGAPEGIWMDPEGSGMWTADGIIDRIYCIAFGDTSFTSLTDLRAVWFKPDGTKAYILQGGTTNTTPNRRVWEFSLSTPWELASRDAGTDFYIGTQESSAQAMYFKYDGTSFYVIGEGQDRVHQYDMSTAWDITSASFVNFFGVGTEEDRPNSLYFSTNGTKMFAMGITGDDVNEYTLSTAWDITSASFVDSFSVASQTTSPASLFFKYDGTEMYVRDTTTLEQALLTYELGTAWDVSTAVFNTNRTMLGQTIYWNGTGNGNFYVDDTGEKLFFAVAQGRRVIELRPSTYL